MASVLKAWGLRGELKLKMFTAHPERFFHLTTVYLGESLTPYAVEHFRWHRQDVLLKLRGCDNRTQAEALRGQRVYIRPEDVPPLGPNEYYAYQLIGLKVITLDGQDLGTLDEVLETGANDVYVVHGPCGQVLLPAHAQVIRQIDLERRVMTVHLMPGLVE